MTTDELDNNSTEYRGFKLSLVQAKQDWCAFVIPPDDQPELLMAEDRKAVLARAQSLIDERIAKRTRQ